MVPPETVTLADPSEPLLQLTSEAEAEDVNVDDWFTVAEMVSVQPLLSVTVTLYDPDETELRS